MSEPSVSDAITRFEWGRSLLFCPGDQPQRFDKALASGADTVVLDLEDGVDPSDRVSARRAVSDYLSVGPRIRVAVRVNRVGSRDCMLDIEAMRDSGIAAFVVPKVSLLGRTQELLQQLFQGRPLPAMCATIESALGAVHLDRFGEQNEIFDAVSWGPYDLAGELGIRQVRVNGRLVAPLESIRSTLLTVAAAFDLKPLETVSVQYGQSGVTGAEAREAANLGFVGKFAIHPSQISVIHDAFMPDAKEIERAEEILARCHTNGQGASSYDGEMLDEAIYRSARKVLAAAGHNPTAKSRDKQMEV